MEIYAFVVNVVCLVCVTLDMLFPITADGLGVSDLKFPPKFNYYNHNLRPVRKPNGRSSRSGAPSNYVNANSQLGEESIEQSRILHFINTIRTNSSTRTSYCKNNEKTIVLTDFKYTFSATSFQNYHNQSMEGKFIANYLTNLFNNKNARASDIRSLKDAHAIISLLKSVVDDDPILAGGAVAFTNPSRMFPYLSAAAKDVTNVTDFYNYSNAEYYITNSKTNAETAGKLGSAATGVTTTGYNGLASAVSVIDEEAVWGQPYYDCVYLNRWITAVSFPFYGLQEKSRGTTRELRGVVLLYIDLDKTPVNQCAGSTTPFAASHKCRPETTQCHYTPKAGFRPGNYDCQCKAGFYFPVLNATQKFYTGTQLERHFLQSMRNDSNYTDGDYQCLPCRQGCVGCADDSRCFVEYNILMRGIPLGIQSFCMTITLVLGIVVLRFRKCKVMVISMWCLLEIILLGALFIYATVVIQYFEPTTTSCLIVPWLREVGFAILYGALVLKIYRLLGDFQSRKAHRVHMRDKDLLKYLLSIVVVVCGYMAAWTAINMDQVGESRDLVDEGSTAEDDLRYFVCRSGWWDISTEVAEVLFLLFGIYLCYRVRAAPSEFSEAIYVSAAICYECFISTVFYVLRHIYWLDLHPDYLFLMYFLRCQLTVTVTLILVFGPKLWYAHRPPDDRQIRNRAYSSSEAPDSMAPETMKLNVGISSNGDVDVGEVSLADMDPEDIRAELKRLYSQLQIYKTRSMRKDNPHISKRRGGRKQTHRRFSLQAFHHKHRHHHGDHDHDHEMSKTPEESTNSAEGFTLPIEMSVSKCEELNEAKSPATVSFKMCHSHK